MLTKDDVVLLDEFEGEVVFSIEYNDCVFTFDSAEERSRWLEECSTEELDFLIEMSQEDEKDAEV